MENIKQPLETEIVAEFEALNELEFGSEQHKIAVDGLTKLVDRAIEIHKVEKDYEAKKESREFDKEKIEVDKTEKAQNREFDREKFKLDKDKFQFDKEKFEVEQTGKTRDREFDNKLQLDNAKHDKRFKWIKVVLDAAIPAASITTGLFLALKSFRFEEYGTITSTVGKASINKSLSRML